MLLYDSRSCCEVQEGCALAVAYYPPNTCHCVKESLPFSCANTLILRS